MADFNESSKAQRDKSPSPHVSFKDDIATTIPSKDDSADVNNTQPIADDTGKDKTSTGLSAEMDRAWGQSYVLSFDGGGVRGLSSLFILKRLIEMIAEIESPDASSSHHPLRPKTSHVVATDRNILTTSSSPALTTSSRPNSVPSPKFLSHDEHRAPRRTFTLPISKPHTKSNATTSSQYLPCHYFDYICGTSTGGLVAIMLGRLRMSVDECIDLFVNLSPQIFGHPRPPKLLSYTRRLTHSAPKYNAQKLQDAVKQVVESKIDATSEPESETYLKQSRQDQCRTIVVALKVKEKNEKTAISVPYLFRSYDHPAFRGKADALEMNPGKADEVEIWKVARATSAAPTYFKSVSIDHQDFIDGSFGANNPSLLAYHEVKQMHNGAEDSVDLLISIGTGTESGMTIMNRPKIFGKDIHKRMEDIISSTDITPESVTPNRPSKSDKSIEQIIQRFSCTKGLEKIKLDEWVPSDLHKIRSATENYLASDEIKSRLGLCAQKLVSARRERSKTPRWEDFALGVTYGCPITDCFQKNNVYHRRDQLLSHLQREHLVPPPGPDNYEELEGLLDQGKQTAREG